MRSCHRRPRSQSRHDLERAGRRRTNRESPPRGDRRFRLRFCWIHRNVLNGDNNAIVGEKFGNPLPPLDRDDTDRSHLVPALDEQLFRIFQAVRIDMEERDRLANDAEPLPSAALLPSALLLRSSMNVADRERRAADRVGDSEAAGQTAGKAGLPRPQGSPEVDDVPRAQQGTENAAEILRTLGGSGLFGEFHVRIVSADQCFADRAPPLTRPGPIGEEVSRESQVSSRRECSNPTEIAQAAGGGENAVLSLFSFDRRLSREISIGGIDRGPSRSGGAGCREIR